MALRALAGKLGRLGAVAAFCLGLGGCFDFEQSLSIQNDGSGALAVMVRLDPAFQDALADDQILPPQANPVEVKRGVRDGQFVQEERVVFNSLVELKTRNETLSITNNGATFFGLGPKRLTLARSVDNRGADSGNFGLMRNLFQDRYYVFSADLPGWVDQAYPVEVAGEAVEPDVSGSTVTWRIPMAKAISANTLEFKVDFRAYLNIEAVAAAERIDGGVPHLARGVLPY